MRDIEALSHERVTNLHDLVSQDGTLLENNNIHSLVLDLHAKHIFLGVCFDVLKESERLATGSTE